MDDITYAALDQMLGNGLVVNSVLDNKKAVLALRAAYDPMLPVSEAIKDYETVKDMILRKRANWRRYLTENQRRWQRHERSVTQRSCVIRYNRWGQNHDLGTIIRAGQESIMAREKYVRCDGKDHSARELERTFV